MSAMLVFGWALTDVFKRSGSHHSVQSAPNPVTMVLEGIPSGENAVVSLSEAVARRALGTNTHTANDLPQGRPMCGKTLECS